MAKIKIKTISGETYLDEAADTLTFAGLRAKLAAEGKMTAADTFEVDGAAIARANEGTVRVTVIASKDSIIEIRGPSVVERRLIRVTMPTGARSLKVATDTTLSALRAALEASMSLRDVFTYPDGVSVAAQDEAALRVSDVLRDKGTEKDTIKVETPMKAREW